MAAVDRGKEMGNKFNMGMSMAGVDRGKEMGNKFNMGMSMAAVDRGKEMENKFNMGMSMCPSTFANPTPSLRPSKRRVLEIST